jgi:hypothetical protein
LTTGEVKRALTLLDVGKAYGPDGLPPVVLRECSRVLAPVLTKLFRIVLKTNIFPNSWKHAVIQPVPKKGDPSDPTNYRPIAITSVVSKVFESLINSKLTKHLESHRLLSDHQYGFRSARSCGDLLAYVTDTWARSLSCFGESAAVALDISKAFDRVWHNKLISKLPSFGIPQNLCTLISSYLVDRSIAVRVDGHTSCSKHINSGVPQGSVLSPTLFLLFINDLLGTTANPIHSYADDSTLHMSSAFSAPPNQGTLRESRRLIEDAINHDMASIVEWGNSNLVKFNASKTQCTSFSLKKLQFLPQINFNNSAIETSNSLSMLGITFHSDLSWKTHITSLAKAASQKLGVLFRFRSYFTSNQLLTLYVGTIRPCMEYCSHIWGSSPGIKLLDRVEAKAFRLISSTPLTDHLPSLSMRREVAALSLFYRYYFGRCSAELHNCIPPPLVRPRSTRQATQSHKYSVVLYQTRIERYSKSFFPATSVRWNKLPEELFPVEYNLNIFKSNINRYLRQA